MLTAQWIWKPQDSYQVYNQTIIAQKTFTLRNGGEIELRGPGGRREVNVVREATVRVTADSYYRLFINGEWVNDGPCRSWPEHYQYDVMDVTSYMRPGKNDVRVVARYWGVGNFHTVPRQAGLLLQLDVTQMNGERVVIATDGTWEVAEARAWLRNTPKVSIQMEPQEVYDARLEDGITYEPAAVLYRAGEGPWQDLRPRDVALLTRQPFAPRAFLGANLVRRKRDLVYCLPAALLARPGLVEANHSLNMVGAVAAVLRLAADAQVQFGEEDTLIYVDGQRSEDSSFALSAGDHLAVAYLKGGPGHNKEKTFRIACPPPALKLVNPLEEGNANPWVWIDFGEYAFADTDMRWQWFGLADEHNQALDAYRQRIAALGPVVKDRETLGEVLGGCVRVMPGEEMFVLDSHRTFLDRVVTGSAINQVMRPSDLMYDNPEVTLVHPHPEGDVELIYDLGEQTIGYYTLEMIAEAGVKVDIYEVEYISPNGEIQHTWGNRNGMRYITRTGLNRFTSTKRRSGRYLFITLRSLTAPVRIRRLQVIESTYPVDWVGNFHCSDARLEKIWEISARTLKLCMEDTFTDCPLYEQTLWVGDARNEAVFAYDVFGATDIARRCIRLAGQSLERYPITGCQVPSSWDCLLPAWSFLWGISVWDYYFYTSDKEFLREIWPAVIRNLEGAENHLDANGLFSGMYWNMFDWSGIDDHHAAVLHNSLLMVGAVDAAQKCAQVLGDSRRSGWLADLRQRLTFSLNRLWDVKKGAYPDSIHADGTVSPSTSQHTSFLALLYDVIDEEHTRQALANVIQPPEGMVRVGSPFAIMYYYEALEKMGRPEVIMQSIFDSYLPMLEDGATTVWEVFPASQDRPQGFPTRSHCHAWSSAPVHFLSRIVLGIKATQPGGMAFEISPRITGCEWASGTVATQRGPLSVSWRVQAGELRVKVTSPEGVQVKWVENESHQGLKLVME